MTKGLRNIAKVIVLAGTTALLPATLMAQGPTAATNTDDESAAQSRSQSFRSVSGPQKEDVSGGTLMLGAYAVLWTGVFLYLLHLGRRSRKLQVQIEKLEQQLESQQQR